MASERVRVLKYAIRNDTLVDVVVDGKVTVTGSRLEAVERFHDFDEAACAFVRDELGLHGRATAGGDDGQPEYLIELSVEIPEGAGELPEGMC